MPDTDNRPNFYGRRQGKRIRAHRRHLIEQLSPRFAIDLAADAVLPGGVFPPVNREIWLEIGFGGGEHLVWQAIRNPEVGLIGVEPFRNGVARLYSEIDTHSLRNIRVFDDDVRLLLPHFADASISRCFVLFPDPWPKARHHKRRLINQQSLSELARVLADGGELRIATDHLDYGRWILWHLLNHPDFEWSAERSRHWQRRPEDWPATRYEEKAIAAGLKPLYLRFLRRFRSKVQQFQKKTLED